VEAVTETRGRTTTHAFFGRAAEACLAAVTAYEAEHEPDVRFQRHVLLALAALDECSRRSELEPADLRSLADAAAVAAGVCRATVADDRLVTVAAWLDDVVGVCAQLLGEEPPPDEWNRFVFDDLDFSLLRAHNEWRLTRPGAETAGRVFDEALEALDPSLSNFRIAAITIQVLAWHARAEEA
jgi:hypothetical protein